MRAPISTIAAAALARSEGLVMGWLPDGRRRGSEWVARNPTRNDSSLGSFSVNLATGRWADFASGDKGGDLVSLVAYLRNVGQGEAAQLLASDLGMARNEKPATRRRWPQSVSTPAPQPKRHAQRNLGTPTPPPAIVHPKKGTPSASWAYRNERREIVGFACRFDHPDGGKDVLPLSWDGSGWEWKAMPEPRPLFNLPELLARPAAVVIVTEGEKAASAAADLLPSAVTSTWAGGSAAWRKTDWQPLKGRKVILWPDNDQPGLEAMAAIHDHLMGEIRVARLLLPTLPEGLPEKFDAADIPPDLGTAFALALIKGTAAAPANLCPICWANSIAAPANGPTCPHNAYAWPSFAPDHPDFHRHDED